MVKGSKSGVQRTQPARIFRILLGTLLGLNLIAAALVLYPPGGSAQDLERQLASLQAQLAKDKTQVEQTRLHASSVEKGRTDGDKFLDEHFLARRSAYATLLADLDQAARQAHLKDREIAYAIEPVDGSESLSMMTITANYEASYRDLMNFVHQIDQSPRLLIIDSLNAAPLAGGNTLSVSFKLNAFVREEGADPALRASAAGSAQ